MTPFETIKLYDTDGHLNRFSAKVISCDKKDNFYEIVLDKTAFFPEGGGQGADTGKIGNARVSDVQIYGNVIIHKADIPLEIGAEYDCEIDYDVRFRRMQNHTGEHIVSGLVHKYFGYDNTGFHMGRDDITVDFNGILTDTDIRKIEFLANKAVFENKAVTAYYPEEDELSALEYRSKKEITGRVRIVNIEGYDSCACCAPHVSHTGEVGIIKLLDFEKNKGGIRIHMLCGFDALEDYERRYKLMANSAKSLSIGQMQLGEAIVRLGEEISALKQKNYAIREELYAYKMEKIEHTEGNICIFEEDIRPSDMRNLMNGALEKCGGISAVFCGSDENGYMFFAASKKLKMREQSIEMREKLGAKCGGSDEMIQGSVSADKKTIKKYFGVL